jgi:hypothetical protein
MPFFGPQRLRRLFFVSACVIAAGALDTSIAQAQTQPCKEAEKTQPAPEGAQNLIELQTNAARPTFDVELDYHPSGDDDISFTPKAGRRPGSDADVAAEFTDAPRYKELAPTSRVGGHAARLVTMRLGKVWSDVVGCTRLNMEGGHPAQAVPSDHDPTQSAAKTLAEGAAQTARPS